MIIKGFRVMKTNFHFEKTVPSERYVYFQELFTTVVSNHILFVVPFGTSVAKKTLWLPLLSKFERNIIVYLPFEIDF